MHSPACPLIETRSMSNLCSELKDIQIVHKVNKVNKVKYKPTVQRNQWFMSALLNRAQKISGAIAQQRLKK